MARRAGKAVGTFGIFAEGSHTSDLRGRDPFSDLWHELCAKTAGTAPSRVQIYGFSKGQITLLGKPLDASLEPLDIFINRMHARDGFDNAVIAFDRKPPNELIPGGCLRHEVNFILERFAARPHLPAPFRAEVDRLLAHYRDMPRQPRGPGRPPRGPLDFLYMNPMFEALLVSDEATIRRALGVVRRPKGWPSFDHRSSEPGRAVLQPAIQFAARSVRRKVRGDMESNKHGWALHFVREMKVNDTMYTHPIIDRLKTLLVA